MSRGLTPHEKLLAEVAITAPARRNKHSVSATIPWELVEAIRAEMERCGIDWKAAQARLNKIVAERRAAREVERTNFALGAGYIPEKLRED